ncbi:MAG: hypothetical protein C5B55_11755 [Blastocatellia bacterium]|nr:MAG: hypothetical protein C5B55_11755 [Blastocatellia bacterium]
MNQNSDNKREFLRHTVATLAYRGGKAVANAPEGFATFKTNESTRTPGQILAHIGDLLDWALGMARGDFSWNGSSEQPWADEVERFFASLTAFDAFLASDAELQVPAEKLFQAPIADALTHVGQIAMLRRMAGGPMRGENYFKADITVGRVGPDQSTVRAEFD